jgi:hypothetical protein
LSIKKEKTSSSPKHIAVTPFLGLVFGSAELSEQPSALSWAFSTSSALISISAFISVGR